MGKKDEHTSIVDYVEQQRASWSKVPLNDLDSLALCILSYCTFENGDWAQCKPGQRMGFSQALSSIPLDKRLSVSWLDSPLGSKFFDAVSNSPRFAELEVGSYVNDVSSHIEKQFSAVTFYLPNNTAFVAFRGTDNTLTGWKEDFNLTFLHATPSQKQALAYLEQVAAEGDFNIILGGHSKGANLAEYAALTCSNEIFRRIACVYSFDGPAFAFDMGVRYTSRTYLAKLKKIVPESSVIGMIFEQRKIYSIARAKGFLLFQHDPLNWCVRGNHFEHADALRSDAIMLGNVLNEWASSHTPKQAKMLVDTLFDVIGSTGAETINQIADDMLTNAVTMIDAVRKQPEELRNTMFDMLDDFAPLFGEEAASHINEGIEAARARKSKKD